jgi:hypothetical protein
MSDERQAFLSACVDCQQAARDTGRKHYLWRDGDEYRITNGLPPEKWLFMAYPGGRKVLSRDGAELAGVEMEL